MSPRHAARLTVSCLLAVGLAVLAHPRFGDTPPSSTSVSSTAPGGVGVRAALEATLARSGGVTRGSEGLGPLHKDPVPRGVDLDDPVDTASLYARAGLDRVPGRAVRADAAHPDAAATTIPPGIPSTPGLAEHVASSCSGNGTDGRRVQAMYLREQSTPSRYVAVLPLLRNEVANVDDVFAVSAAKTGGIRRVRWVHADCVPVVTEVVVPDGSLNRDFRDTVSALKALGMTDRNRKYLAFADANDLCGVGTVYQDDEPADNYNDGYSASYSRVDASCWSNRSISVAAHELTHNLGGVLETAPNATLYGHCTDESDLMCYDDGSLMPMRSVCAGSHEQLLDCNSDDYFNTAPAPGSYLAGHWNTASSSFLDRTLPAPPPGPEPQPEPQPVPAAVAWSVQATEGPSRKLIGTLTDVGTGRVLSGATVTLQIRPRGVDSWRVAPTSPTSLSTDGSGRVVATTTRLQPASYRFAYAGAAQHRAGTSREVFLAGATQMTANWSAKRDRVIGTLKQTDGTRVARADVVLQRRYAGTSRWATVGRATTGATGRAATVQHPRRTVLFRWVFRGDSTRLASRSAAVKASA